MGKLYICGMGFGCGFVLFFVLHTTLMMRLGQGIRLAVLGGLGLVYEEAYFALLSSLGLCRIAFLVFWQTLRDVSSSNGRAGYEVMSVEHKNS